MAIVVPAAPVKPTPPVAPTKPGGDTGPGDGVPAVQAPDPAFVEAVRRAEAIGASLQGDSKVAGDGKAAATADKTAAAPKAAEGANAGQADKPAKNQSLPLGDASETKTETPARPPAAVSGEKEPGVPYMPFVVIVAAVAVTMAAMSFFKRGTKAKQPARPLKMPGEPAQFDIEAPPEAAPKEKKSRFEVRI